MKERVKQLRKSKGISHNELAKRLGISRQSLYSRLKGNMNTESLKEIADALDINYIELINPPNSHDHLYNDGDWLGVFKK